MSDDLKPELQHDDLAQELLNAKSLAEGPKPAPMDKGPQLKRKTAKEKSLKPRQDWLQLNGPSRLEAAFLNKSLYLDKLSRKHQQEDDPKNFLLMTPERQKLHATKIARDVQRLAPLLARRYFIAQQLKYKPRPRDLEQINNDNNIRSVNGSINALTVNPALPTSVMTAQANPIISTQRNGTHAAFGFAIVNLQLPIFHKTG